MKIIVFLTAIISSTLGAIGGFGGGVIIKPVMDALSLLPVSTVSFLSGCTALAMAVSSLARQRNNGIELRYRTTTPLAIGAVIGGLAGKELFEFIRETSQNESVLGGIQAISLAVITAGVLLYILYKNRLKSYRVENVLICCLIGCLLGFISSFLGIGGGTSNVAILFLCFSMDAKTAAKNSLYVIVFSQTASIIKAIITDTVPYFEWAVLILMVLGGVSGAIFGSHLSKKFSNKGVEIVLKVLLVTMVLVNTTNAIKYFCF